MTAQVLDDRRVVCPHCEHQFEVTLSSGGATAAKRWKRISKSHEKILTIWLSHCYRTGMQGHPVSKYALHKTVLYAQLTTHGLKMSMPAFGGRISELKAMGLIIADQDRNANGKKPGYSLNLDKVLQCLNHGGALN